MPAFGLLEKGYNKVNKHRWPFDEKINNGRQVLYIG